MQFSLGGGKKKKKGKQQSCISRSGSGLSKPCLPRFSSVWVLFTRCSQLPPGFPPASVAPSPRCCPQGWEPRREGLGAITVVSGGRHPQENTDTEAEERLLFSKVIFIKIFSKVDRNPLSNLSLYIAKVICIYVQMYMGVFHSADPCNSWEKQNICLGTADELKHTALGLGTGRAWSQHTVLCVRILVTPFTGHTQKP